MIDTPFLWNMFFGCSKNAPLKSQTPPDKAPFFLNFSPPCYPPSLGCYPALFGRDPQHLSGMFTVHQKRIFMHYQGLSVTLDDTNTSTKIESHGQFLELIRTTASSWINFLGLVIWVGMINFWAGEESGPYAFSWLHAYHVCTFWPSFGLRCSKY